MLIIKLLRTINKLKHLANVSEKLARSHWELGAIGIGGVSESKDKVLDTFKSSISYERSRYIIGLP